MKLDSRLQFGPQQTHPTEKLERTFCVICHRPWGWVGFDDPFRTNIVVICDECEIKYEQLEVD